MRGFQASKQEKFNTALQFFPFNQNVPCKKNYNNDFHTFLQFKKKAYPKNKFIVFF